MRSLKKENRHLKKIIAYLHYTKQLTQPVIL